MMRADCRPFRLSDAMILVACLGVGTAWLVSINRRGDERGRIPSTFDFSAPMNRLRAIAYGIDGYLPPLLSWLTVGTLIVRLRRPRPVLRRLGKSPGTVACVLALLAWWLGAIWETVLGLRVEMEDWGTRWLATIQFWLTDYPVTEVGLCVAFGWLAQWLAIGWRPSKCWMDRLGRFAGCAWIAIYLAERFIFAFPYHV